VSQVVRNAAAAVVGRGFGVVLGAVLGSWASWSMGDSSVWCAWLGLWLSGGGLLAGLLNQDVSLGTSLGFLRCLRRTMKMAADMRRRNAEIRCESVILRDSSGAGESIPIGPTTIPAICL
jgi:hypothetical protein